MLDANKGTRQLLLLKVLLSLKLCMQVDISFILAWHRIMTFSRHRGDLIHMQYACDV